MLTELGQIRQRADGIDKRLGSIRFLIVLVFILSPILAFLAAKILDAVLAGVVT